MEFQITIRQKSLDLFIFLSIFERFEVVMKTKNSNFKIILKFVNPIDFEPQTEILYNFQTQYKKSITLVLLLSSFSI